MNELTIANQKYLSSKSAAQVTGYAKDYIGQLCREGRVEARLVGRNWYVLESSILEHRFGPAEGTEKPPETTKEAVLTWKSPVYKTEIAAILPELPAKQGGVPITPPLAQREGTQVLSDMQSAWQEWFKNQEQKEKMLPDASEMMLTEGEMESEVVPSVYKVASEAAPKELPASHPESHQEESVHISRLTTGRSESLHEISRPYETLGQEQVHIIKEKKPSLEHSEVSESGALYVSTREHRVQADSKKQPKTAFVLQALLLSVAGLSVVATVLATGLADRLTGVHTGNPITNYISGITEIK